MDPGAIWWQPGRADGATTYEQREHWVDPDAQEVWEYNLAIAEELQALGVDEIQFDYIRFSHRRKLEPLLLPVSTPWCPAG